MLNLTDAALVVLADILSDMVVIESIGIAEHANETIDLAIGAVDSMASSFEKIANNADQLDPETAKNVSKAFTAAISNVMAALLTDIEPPVAAVDDDYVDPDSGSWKCEAGKTVTTKEATVLTSEQTEKLYKKFISMTKALTSLIQTALTSDEGFMVNEKFFACQIVKKKLNNLAGSHLDTYLSSVQFPSLSDLEGGNLLVESSNIDPDSMVSIVMYGYIKNVFDVSQPFNTPTISLNVYDDQKIPLTLNPEVKILQTGKPLVKKAAKFAKQKVDAQCDISKVTCDLEKNADQLASVARFPIDKTLGPFVLIFPGIEFNYDAFITFNSTASATNYTWKIHVEHRSELPSAWVYAGEPLALPISFKPAEGLRAIVSVQAMDWMFPELSTSSFLNVLTRKNFSDWSGTKLPSSACDLQRVYGYHLKLGRANATDTLTSRRKRRAADPSIDSLDLLPESTESEIKFTSNYMGDIGADLAIPPNTIAFSDVFANFSELVADNWGVLAFMVSTVVFFLIGLVFTWRNDRSDLLEWAYLPLIDNKRCQGYSYLISVNQHGVKNYTEKNSVWIRLIGEVDDTRWRILRDHCRKNFKKSHPENFILNTYYSLGENIRMEMKVVPSEEETRDGNGKVMSVSIDDVLVVDVTNRKKFMFKVNKRLKADCHVVSRDLACEDDVNDWGFLMKKRVRLDLSDNHPWFSIMSRPMPSDWTRVERLACVVTALYMAMLVNCMFYGKDADAPNAGVVIGGFFRISWFTIWTSFIGAVIVIPPTFCIGFVFKKVRRRSAAKCEMITAFNLEEKLAAVGGGVSGDEKAPKKPFRLPFPFVYFGWFLVAACVGTSAFFVMYSLTWGREKSLQWLCGMILHVVQDIVAIQTVKVVLLAIVNSTLLKVPDDGTNEQLQMALNPDNKTKQTMLFKQFRAVLAGIAYNLLYVLSFSLVIGMTVNPNAYRQIVAIRPLCTPPSNFLVENVYGGTMAKTVLDYGRVYDWLNQYMFPNFLNGNQMIFNERGRTKRFFKMINHEIYLLGPIRFRQRRVQTSPCPLEAPLVDFLLPLQLASNLMVNNTECQQEYSNVFGVATSSEHRSFNKSWTRPIKSEELLALDTNTSNTIMASPWSYRESEGMAYSGNLLSYGTGGYFVDIPTRSLANASLVVDSLRKMRWLDNATSGIFVEFTVMNAQLNLFVPVKVVFEPLPAGGLAVHTKLYPLQLYQYFGSNALLNLIIQGLWLFMTVTHFIKVMLLIKKQKKQFFKDGWNMMELLTVLLSFGIMVVYVLRFPHIMKAISDIKTDKSKFVNLDVLVYWEDLMMGLFGICFMMNLFLFFRHLTFNKSWAIFVATLSKGKGDIFGFLAFFTLLTCMYGAFGYLVLGETDPFFSTVARGILTLTYNIIGFNKQLLGRQLSTLSLCFYGSYAFIVFFVGIQVFMAIVNSCYAMVAGNVETMTSWNYDLSDYIGQGFGNLFSSKKHSNMVGPEPEDWKQQPGSEQQRILLERIDRMVKMANKTVESEFQQNSDNWAVVLDSKLPTNYPVTNKKKNLWDFPFSSDSDPCRDVEAAVPKGFGKPKSNKFGVKLESVKPKLSETGLPHKGPIRKMWDYDSSDDSDGDIQFNFPKARRNSTRVTSHRIDNAFGDVSINLWGKQ